MKKFVLLFLLFPLVGSFGFSQTVYDYGGWNVQEQGMATYLTAVSFADHQTGWAIGGLNGLGSAVYGTTDGGATWSIQNVGGFGSMYLGGDCGGPNDLWVSGVQFLNVMPGLMLSHDGGTTWSSKTMPGSLAWSSHYVQALDPDHIRIPSAWQDLFGSAKDGMTVSNDGGKTWKAYKWGAGTYARYCHFIDEQTGWMTGGTWPGNGKRSQSFRLHQNGPDFPLPAGFPGNSRGPSTDYDAAIAKTTDGGKTWTTVFSDTGNFYLNEIFMLDDLEGWAMGEADYKPYILHTTDGWNTVDYQTPPSGQYTLVTVDMFNDQEGISVGFGPEIFDVWMRIAYTNDGGQTWRLHDPRLKTGPMASAFLDRRSGWSVGSNNAQQSTVAAYTNHGDLKLQLSSTPDPNVQAGSQVSWQANAANTGNGSLNFSVWLDIQGLSWSAGTPPYQISVASSVTIAAGASGGGPLSLSIPTSAPAGSYLVSTTIGTPSGIIWDSESFALSVN